MSRTHPIRAQVLLHADDMEVVVRQWRSKARDLHHSACCSVRGLLHPAGL